MLRYCEIAALSYKVHQTGNADQLRDLMMTDQSFQPLGWIASTPNDLAFRVEQDFELRTFMVPPHSHTIEKFHFTDKGLDLGEDIHDSFALHEYEIRQEKGDLPQGKCPAHHHDALQPIYKSFVKICAQDHNLFPLTLAR
jgi:hypothetical protein